MIAKKLNSVRREISVKVYHFGFAGALKLGVQKVLRGLRKGKDQPHDFDIKYGTDTSSRVELGDLDIPDDRLKHAIAYGTAIVDVFLQMLKDLPIDHKEFVFVDMGSGKGRAMMLATTYPFKAIRGVELSRALHETAVKNFQIYKDPAQRCHDLQSVCEDAVKFRLPQDNLVFYLFNPFNDEVIRPVLENIRQSLQKHPRKIYIMYLKTLHRKVFDEAPFLKIMKDTGRYVIYEN